MSQPVSATPRTKPQPVLVFMSVMTGLTGIVGALAVSGIFPEAVVGVAVIVVAGVNQAMAYYVKGQVVPFQDVATYVNDQRTVVTGPAHVPPTGATPAATPD